MSVRMRAIEVPGAVEVLVVDVDHQKPRDAR
jgi:hypothetical protein